MMLTYQQMFGDGGAFPEIHMAQYPMNMGYVKNQTSNAIQLQVDADGKPKFDAIVKQNVKGSKVCFSYPPILSIRRLSLCVSLDRVFQFCWFAAKRSSWRRSGSAKAIWRRIERGTCILPFLLILTNRSCSSRKRKRLAKLWKQWSHRKSRLLCLCNWLRNKHQFNTFVIRHPSKVQLSIQALNNVSFKWSKYRKIPWSHLVSSLFSKLFADAFDMECLFYLAGSIRNSHVVHPVLLLPFFTRLHVKSPSKNNKTGKFHPVSPTGKMLR